MKPDETKLFSEILSAVVEIAPNNEMEIPLPDSFVLGMYWCSIGLYKGILTLLANNQAEEALMLGRSLFTESLRLMELSDAGESRNSLILGWVNKSYEEIKGLFLNAHRLGLDPNAQELIRKYEYQQEKLQGYMRRHHIKHLRKFRPETDAAKRFGRLEDYWTFLLAHEMVHGSQAALVYKREKIADGSVAFFLTSRSDWIVIGVGIFAARSVLDAAIATAHIFNSVLPDGFDEFHHRLTTLTP